MAAERIDVLAVMDAAIARLPDSEAAPLDEARAAVAELIEADKEYDAALTSWDAVRVTEAKQRRAAALARMGEGA